MNTYEQKLKTYMLENNIDAEQLFFKETCHSVSDAAKALGTSEDSIVKNICMISGEGKIINAIVKGEDRVSTSKVGKVLNIETPRIATANEIAEKTGYVVGGVPSFGYDAHFIIDERVMEKDIVYTGGGSPNSLIKIPTKVLQQSNNGIVAKIRK